MKKSLLALAVAAAVSPAAFAQTNVTMYGIADAGVSWDDNRAPGLDGAIRVNSGYMSSSRFGITGTEDLGAGLKGVFTLEMGYDIDNGGFKQYRGNPGGATASAQNAAGIVNTNAQGTNIFGGFNRRSFVGLQGGFGTIALGRDYTPFFWAQLATDNLGYGLYGNLLNSTQLSGTGSELFLRASNAVFYTSPKFGGLTIRGMASAGAETFSANALGTLPKEANRMYSIGAEYGAGPLTIAAAIQQVELATVGVTGAFTGGTSDRRDAVIGAKYNFGLFSLGAGYARFDPSGSNNNSEQAWIGGTIGLGKGSLILQYNRIEQDIGLFNGVPRAAALGGSANGKADTISLSYTYPFSRRTTAYASYGYVRNNNSSAVGLFASDNAVTAGAFGSDPRGFVVGVRHSF